MTEAELEERVAGAIERSGEINLASVRVTHVEWRDTPVYSLDIDLRAVARVAIRAMREAEKC